MISDEFVTKYIGLRRKEQRLYTDAEVLALPWAEKDNPHFNEWKIRKKTVRRLLNYITKLKPAADILEIGCGNGWLTAQMAKATSGNITGLDVNEVELE